MKREIQAIPTIYRGIELKSRMESKCALLLDLLDWKWEYEPFSVMLDGINYMPDFYVPERGYVIECRGYDSEKGREQILRFARSVIDGDLKIPNRPIKRYQVIGPDVAWDCAFGGEPQETHFCLCDVCERWMLDTKDCGCNGKLYDFEEIAVHDGEISLGFGWWPSAEWDRELWRFSLRGRSERRLYEIRAKAAAALMASGWGGLCTSSDLPIVRNNLSSQKYSIAINTSDGIFKRILAAAMTLACAEQEDVLWVDN